MTGVSLSVSPVERARRAAQDRGAELGMLSTQPDAYGLGEAGLAAIRVMLEALDDEFWAAAAEHEREATVWTKAARRVEALLREARGDV